MLPVQEVEVPRIPLQRLEPALLRDFGPFQDQLVRAGEAHGRRHYWHVNSTATGGGVAEMLLPLTGYARSSGLNARWLVIAGNGPFFDLTKRIHNAIHGVPVRLEPEDRVHYEHTLRHNADQLVRVMRRGDFALCHDPQTAGLIPHLKRAGIKVMWRSHIGHEEHSSGIAAAWRFLQPYLREAEAVVFSRRQYYPRSLEGVKCLIEYPSIDPLSAKNMRLTRSQVKSILVRMGFFASSGRASEPLDLPVNGQPVSIQRRAQILRDGDSPPLETRLIVQISRWDRLKDPVGVMEGFARHVREEAHLVLAGPDVEGVDDDPEGAQVFAEVKEAWHRLPARRRVRVHVVSLPMVDVNENALMVNALQTAASVVVQKSLYEGFGLTVTEAMWKSKPVVASAVGGIQDQIESGVHGLLIQDPTDLRSFGRALDLLLKDRKTARRMGRNARRRVAAKFLISRHLLQLAHYPSSLGNIGNGG